MESPVVQRAARASDFARSQDTVSGVLPAGSVSKAMIRQGNIDSRLIFNIAAVLALLILAAAVRLPNLGQA